MTADSDSASEGSTPSGTCYSNFIFFFSVAIFFFPSFVNFVSLHVNPAMHISDLFITSQRFSCHFYIISFPLALYISWLLLLIPYFYLFLFSSSSFLS
ncbi:hypothetical protein J3F83DRAFT_732279 [Trichoderma novae-zelandiae]